MSSGEECHYPLCSLVHGVVGAKCTAIRISTSAPPPKKKRGAGPGFEQVEYPLLYRALTSSRGGRRRRVKHARARKGKETPHVEGVVVEDDHADIGFSAEELTAESPATPLP